MTEYKELSLCECVDILLSLERPLVLMHVRPDGDTVGSAAGLMTLFSMLGRSVKYACADKVPDRLAFLLEGFSLASEEEYSAMTPISIDVPSPMQLGDIIEKIPSPRLMIDHHEVAMPFADIFTVRGMSSAGEVLYLIAEEMIRRGLVTMTPELAYPIYAAISSDTGSFAYSNTTSDTYRTAARLIDTGIDFTDINHRLFSSKSKEQLKAEGLVSARLYTAKDGRIAYSFVGRSERLAMGLLMEHFETAIELVRSVRGAEIAFIVKETDKGEFKGSLRSVGADVTKVASRFMGGGHIRAAGCTVAAGSAEEAAEILLRAVEEEYFKE